MQPRHRKLALFAGFAALTLIFWATRIVGPEPGGDGLAVDLLVYIHPMNDWARNSILAGHLPLWNPYQFAGHPFIATGLVGFFYPLNALLLALPTHLAIEANVLLHIFLAGCFTYAFARTIGQSFIAAVAAAVTFMLSGYVASRAVWFTPALDACVWLPLGLVAVEKLCTKGGFRWVVLLSLVIAMPMLTGWWQVWMFSTYTIGGYSALRLGMLAGDKGRRGQVPALAGLLILGLAIGIGLAAVQLLPSLELGQQGPRRPGGLTAEQMLAGTLSPPKLLKQMVDSEPGHPRQFYLGMVALVLIPFSLFGRAKRATVAYFWFLMAASALVAITSATPFFELYRMLPATSWFRVPQRIAYLYAFSGAMLTGFGLDTLVRIGSSRDRRLLLAAAVVSAAAAAWWYAAAPPAKSLAWLGVGLGTACVASLIRTPRVVTLASVALLLLIGADLFQATRNTKWRPIHDVDTYDLERTSLDFVSSEQGLDRTYFNPTWSGPPVMHKQGMRRGIFSITDYEPLSSSRVASFYEVLEKPGSSRLAHHPFVGRLSTDPSLPNFRLIDLLSVRFVMLNKLNFPLRRTFHEAGWRGVFASPDANMVVYRNPRPIPRVYLAGSAREVPDEAAALAAIQDPDFDPFSEVVIEANGEVVGLPNRSAGQAIEPVTRVEYDREEVSIEVDVEQPCYLVLTDSHYPGWVARVDGRESPILRANFLFRAVLLEPGAREVTFRYEPASILIGAMITSACIAGLAVSLAISFRRDRFRSGSQAVAEAS